MKKWENYLKKLYFNPKTGFLGVNQLYNIVKAENKFKISKGKIKKWLKQFDAYTLHKPVKRSFKRSRLYIEEKNILWDSDLADMTKYKKDNDGFSYILVVIDVFTRRLFTTKLKSKAFKEIKNAFENIFSKDKPRTLRTDGGSEFNNVEFAHLLENHNIKHIVARNEMKASRAERVIGTIKGKLFRYFTYKNTYKWFDVLQDFTENYNNSYHSTLKMSPNEAYLEKNQNQAWAEQFLIPYIKSMNLLPDLYKKKPHNKEKKYSNNGIKNFKYKINDFVRISYTRKAFERIYDHKFSGELFRVFKRYRRQGQNIYRLVDLNQEDVKGSFYESELQGVTADLSKDSFKIEKILKKRKLNNKTQYLVKWLYYPNSFNSYVDSKSVTNLVKKKRKTKSRSK